MAIDRRRLDEKLDGLDRIRLANLPTPLYRLDRISEALGRNVWIKRDDFTGAEMSGNKVRKLEFTLAKALREGADVLLTAGGIQSNHARATAAAAARLGLRSHLVLSVSSAPPVEGNYLLDRMLGAEITLLDEGEGVTLSEKMERIAGEYHRAGHRPYIIPVGASDGVGNLGYLNALREILRQEEELGVTFGAVVCAAGSGGTYGGLWLGNRLYGAGKRIVGITVCDNRNYFCGVCGRIVGETLEMLGLEIGGERDFTFIDGYKGRGYALSTAEELSFIASVAAREGVILDPVYTGKAFLGLCREAEKGTFDSAGDLLFIHTGGQYGLFPKQGQMADALGER